MSCASQSQLSQDQSSYKHTDGLNFRYLSNFPIAVAILSSVAILSHRSYRWLKRDSRIQLVDRDTLLSPQSDSDLAKLESDVILSSVAASLLPTENGSKEEKYIPAEQSEKIVEDFKQLPRNIRRWNQVTWVVKVVGALIWAALEIAKAARGDGSWKGVVYPVSQHVASLMWY